MESLAEDRGPSASARGEAGEGEPPSAWRSPEPEAVALPELLVPDRGTLLQVLHLIIFIDVLGTALVMPVVPHLGRAFDAGPGGVGFLYAVYALGVAVSRAVSSPLSARIGRRRTMLVLLAARALAFFLQGLTQAFGTFLATRLFTGLVAGTTSVARASTCDLAAPKERSRVLAASDFAAAAALIVGPGLGGGLAAFGLHTPILVASASSVFGLALAAGLLLGMPDEEASSGAPAAEDPARSAADGGDRGGDEEGREGAGDEEEGEGEGRAVEEENEEEKVEVEEEEEGHATGPGRAHGSLAGGAASEAAAWLRHPFRRLIPVVLLASLCSVAGGTGLYTMFALLVADEFGYGADAWGFLLSGTALVVVVTQLAVYPAMARSLGKHFAAVSASLTMAVGVAIVPLAAVPAPTLLFAVLYAMGFAAVAPAAHALLLRYAPPPARARILGWQGALTSFAHVVVPPFLGLFYANAPYTPFAVSALLGTSAAFLFAVALLLNQRAHEQAARAAAVETGARDGQRLLSARQREGEDEGGHTASGEGSATASGAAAAGEALTAEQVFGADTGGEGAGAGAGEDSRRASSVHSGEEAARAADVEVAPQPSIRTNTAEADTGRLLLAALRRRGLANLAAADLASRQRLHDLLERVIPPAEDVSAPALFMLPGNVGPDGEEAEEVQAVELPISM